MFSFKFKCQFLLNPNHSKPKPADGKQLFIERNWRSVTDTMNKRNIRVEQRG